MTRFSRVQWCVHVLLTVRVGRAVTIGRGDGRFAVAPMAAPGGGGVGFTWISKKGQ